MKKHLLLIGLWVVLTFNSAQAQSNYYEDDSYYIERPRQVRSVNYEQPRYRDVKYIREESPRYHRVSSDDSIRYQESDYRQTRHYNEPKINKIRPYIGFDIATQEMKFGKTDDMMKDEDGTYFKDSSKSISGIIGARINQHFGIEAYYQQSSKEDKKTTLEDDFSSLFAEKDTLSYRSYGADLIGFLPISQEFELLTALGIGQYDFEAEGRLICTSNNEVVDTIKKDFDSFGIRLGLGAQYNITDHFALRGMFRYIHMTDDDYIKHLTEISLGLRYMF